MIFDPRKFEAIHFSRKTVFPNLEIKLPLPTSANGFGELRMIKPILKKASLRWLEIYFDSCLFFLIMPKKWLARGKRQPQGFQC